MCPRHHKLVDTDVATYTVEILVGMKERHEAKAERLDEPSDDFASLLETKSLHVEGDIVVSVNQSGGQTAGTIINQAPEPYATATTEYVNRPSDEGYVSRVVVAVQSPYPVGNLRLTVVAESIVSLDVNPMRSGMFMTGHTGKRPGYCFTNIPNASGMYRLDICSAKPEQINVEYAIA